MKNQDQDTSERASEFASQARGSRRNIVSEFVSFLMHNKKWWMTPIILVLLLLGVFVLLSSTVVAPFIYTLF